jgi:hypothetical protein
MTLRYKAIGNAVTLALTDHLVAEGYANETEALVCTCCALPDRAANEVAEEITHLLNMADYWPINNLREEKTNE